MTSTRIREEDLLLGDVRSFFFNDTATTEIYTLSLHDALPIWPPRGARSPTAALTCPSSASSGPTGRSGGSGSMARSEEHTSELQSRQYLVCRLLLAKKTQNSNTHLIYPGQAFVLPMEEALYRR